MQTTGRELILAASLMARPELTKVVFPKGHTAAVTNALAREVISVLFTQGPAYSSPGAMEAALVDRGTLGAEDEVEEFALLVSARPRPEEVRLEDLLSIKAEVEDIAATRRLASELKDVVSQLLLRPEERQEGLARVRRSLQDYSQRGQGRDPSSAAVLSRMEAGDNNIRWKMGIPIFDETAEGIGPDGNFDYGCLGQGETSVVLAQYGVGKTRFLYNEVVCLLDQGANVSIIALEDSDTSYLAKLIGVRFGIPKARILRHAKNRALFRSSYGEEETKRIDEARAWAEVTASKLRIYDEKTRHRLGKYEVLMNTLEEDAALYGTTHTFLDYLQAAIKSPEIAIVEERIQDLRAWANRTNVHLQVLSQLSNESMKSGVAAGTVAAKGTSEVGQIAHWAWELRRDPEVGQRELQVIQQKGRDAGLNLAYIEMDEETGKILRSKGTPDFFGGGTAPDLQKPAPKRGGKKTAGKPAT